MWKLMKVSRRGLLRLGNVQNCNRTFLSEAYRCTDPWNKRYESPLLSKINVNEMFIELDQKFQSAGKASAVDIDIYTNVIKGPDHVDELVDILHKFRLSPETTSIMDSTHHAVIRYLLEVDQIEELFTILNDRINYGIFPDHLCYNILMDTFIKKEDYMSAARIASLIMLQEESENPISNALAVYSCHKYLENPGEAWKGPEPEPEEDPKAEVVKVRVRFIRNPYFDDHFDLKEPSEIVGKTLVFFGKLTDDVLGRTCRLRGLILWKKYGEAAKLIENWINEGRKDCIYSEAIPLLEKHIASIPEDKVTDEIKALQIQIDKLAKSDLKEGSILEDMEMRIKKAVDEQAELDIKKQCEVGILRY